MKVRFLKLSDRAVTPRYAKPGDAAVDLVATSKRHVGGLGPNGEALNYIEYGTDLAFEIPENHVGLLFPRSSISNKELFLTNAVGVLDSAFRGEVKARFKPSITQGSGEYEIGDRVIQMIVLPYPQIEFEEAKELTTTERSTGGFGSTGR